MKNQSVKDALGLIKIIGFVLILGLVNDNNLTLILGQ